MQPSFLVSNPRLGGEGCAGPRRFTSSASAQTDSWVISVLSPRSIEAFAIEDFDAATFALDPKRHRSLHGVFGTLKPAACDGLSDKILLLQGEVYLHVQKLAETRPKNQGNQ
jgi:hypothetical protein